jgi:hypothetical protein
MAAFQGFFRSLFTSGFVESTPKTGRRFLGQDEIDIVCDDQNITRAGACPSSVFYFMLTSETLSPDSIRVSVIVFGQFLYSNLSSEYV